MSEDKEKVMIVISEEKGAGAIRKAIADAEKDLGVNSNSDVRKGPKTRGLPEGTVTIIVEVGKAFVKAVVDKYGDRFVSWLSKKLDLDKTVGEKAEEPPKKKKTAVTVKATPKVRKKK